MTKHFETHYHYAPERVAKGSLLIKHVPATQQIADVFTKSLLIHSFQDLRYKLGVEEPPTSSLRGSISKAGPLAHEQLKPTFKLNTPTVTCSQSRPKSNTKDSSTVPVIKTHNMFSVLSDKE